MTTVGAVLFALSNEPVLFLVSMAVPGVGTRSPGSAPLRLSVMSWVSNAAGTVVAVFPDDRRRRGVAGPLLRGYSPINLAITGHRKRSDSGNDPGIVVVVLMPETKRSRPWVNPPC